MKRTNVRRIVCAAAFTWLLVSFMQAAHAQTEPVVVENDRTRFSINPDEGGLVHWEVCYQSCSETGNAAYRQSVVNGDIPIEITIAGAPVEHWNLLRRGQNWIEMGVGAASSDMTPPVVRIELRQAYEVRMTIQGDLKGTLALRLRRPEALDPEPGYGFTGTQERLTPIAFQRGELVQSGELTSQSDSRGTAEHQGALVAEWVGFRSRFWALLAANPHASNWRFVSQPESASFWETRIHSGEPLTLYAGPTAPDALRNTDPVLARMVFDGMWFWLRWLSLSLLYLLDTMASFFKDNWGIAIIALSVVVRIMMQPLIRLAENWQANVNRIQSQLQPRIDAIKRESKGDEQAIRILAAHKEMGVTPFYTFRSAFGFFIQIPVFIVAFNVLNDATGLNGADFLWINDLSRPDDFATLPWVIPFFGDQLNLLPFLMTAITIAGARLNRDSTLSDALLTRRRRSLVWMAVLFFVLFYTFPAGMVLYWTSNVLLHSIRDMARNVRLRPAVA